MDRSATQLTFAPHDHVLTHCNVFSPDGEWIVYDVRSKQGGHFDGGRIERVRVCDGTVQTVFKGRNGACCGVATCSPVRDEVVFIVGPEHPTPDFSYGAARRHGVIVDVATGTLRNLDARDLAPPFTPGALRGGTHVHVFNSDASLASFTCEDHVLESHGFTGPHDRNTRTVGVSVLDHPVRVPATHPRNHDGAYSVVVVETVNEPEPGSDQTDRAFEEAWVGRDGYVRADGSRQRHALAFQGHVRTQSGETVSELFIVDLPQDLTRAGAKPLQGTPTTRPGVPVGCSQRRLTRTDRRAHPGLQGPRHWVRSSPDGSRIAFLMKDDSGIVQLFTIAPTGGEPMQLTRNPRPIASVFTWSPCGRFIAHVMDERVCITRLEGGETIELFEKSDSPAPRPEACVFSPDGKRIAFIAPAGEFDQIFLAAAVM